MNLNYKIIQIQNAYIKDLYWFDLSKFHIVGFGPPWVLFLQEGLPQVGGILELLDGLGTLEIVP